MGKHVPRSLTSGRIEATFDEVITSLQGFGFRQSVFEVERLGARERDSRAPGVSGEVIVLRPSSTQVPYPLIKPGDRVYCTGLEEAAAGSPALYRIRRMAEGFSRRTMVEHT